MPTGGAIGAGRVDGRESLLAHAEALHHLARHLVRDRAQAEDLVQETYARAFRALPRMEPGSGSRAWLCRILRNAHLDACRRERRSPFDRDASPADAAERARPADGALRGDAELEMLRAVVAREISSALQRLPEGARLVVLLDAEGFSEEEIAEAMDCPAGTVKSRLSRGRAELRELLADYRRQER